MSGQGEPQCEVSMSDVMCEYWTRKRCFACGQYACARCSRIVKWFRGKRHRVCNDCLEGDGMKTTIDLRVEREAREEGSSERSTWCPHYIPSKRNFRGDVQISTFHA